MIGMAGIDMNLFILIYIERASFDLKSTISGDSI